MGQCGSPPVPARLQGDSERRTSCETVAAKPSQGLSCPQACVAGVLQELLGMEPALVSKAAASASPAEPWPRDPLRYGMLLPEAPQACGRGRATPPRGAACPPAAAVPPSPLCLAPRVAWGEPALSNPGRNPPVAPGRRFRQSPSRREVGQQNAAAAATRDNRVATVQSVIQQTATCRGTPAQSDRPTAQPDAEECLKLQHEQTRLHIWKQLALEAAIWKFSLVT